MSAPELLASYWTICGAAEPHSEREYSPFSLPDRAASAARAGFTGMGFWHADVAHLRQKHSLPEMKRILADNGIKHIELEFLTDWFVEGEKRKASDVTRRMLMETAAGGVPARQDPGRRRCRILEDFAGASMNGA